MAAGSPYLIQGNITVQAGATLTIEPGVEVSFTGNYSLTVNGFLQAIGTASDSIYFTAVTSWMGLSFTNAPDSSHLAYCTISGSTTNGGLSCSNSNPVITHSTITENSSSMWGGVNLSNSNPSITYCTISNNDNIYRGGGISMSNSSPHISYCTITGNWANSFGGGIYISDGNPLIDNCTIIHNKSGGAGGGISMAAGNSLIDNCTISHNSSNVGGGIQFFSGGQATITGCVITTDTANSNGGGIYVSSFGGSITINNSNINHCKAYYGGGAYILNAGSASITECTFESNVVNNFGGGGGIYISTAGSVSLSGSTLDDNSCGSSPGGVIYSANCSNLEIDHCDVVNNHGLVAEGGIHLNGNTAMTLENCIFRSQTGPDIWFENYTSASVTYSDFYGTIGPGGPFANPPAGLGTISQTNANGDPCDVFYNIFLDPLFGDFPAGDYNLTATSPCIDAGDPGSAFDPDCTLTDMGRYFFDQGPCTRTWSGAIDENWANPLNWNPNGVPGSLDNVIIPGTATHMPKVMVTGLECNDILIEDGAELTINPGIIFTVNGTVTREGF